MMTTGLEQIKWPALRFGAPNCTVLKYNSDSAIKQASARTLACWQQMDEYYLVDARGQRHNLVDPQLIQPLGGLARSWWKISGTKRPVLWRDEVGEVLTVSQIREMILANFDEYKNVWQAYDIDELKQRLAAAQSIDGIMTVFG